MTADRRLRRFEPWAWTLPALGFLLPVTLGVAVTTARLLSTSDVNVGCCDGVTPDAHAISFGGPLYQNPDDGYTGSLYTPLVPGLIALGDVAHLWRGWAVLIAIVASIALAALAGRLAWVRPIGGRAHRLAAVVEAAGIGALAWWLVSNIRVHDLYSPRPDQAAWALALSGLVLLPSAARGSRAAGVSSVLLLTCGFWAKQTAAVAVVVALVWLGGLVVLRAIPTRRALGLIGGLVAAILAVLGALNLLTGGWEWFFNFELPRNQVQIYDGVFAAELARDAGPAAAIAAGLWALVWLAGPREPRGQPIVRLRRWAASAGWAQLLASVLALFVVVAAIAATYFRRKQGGEDNQYVGLVWGIGLLAGLGWRLARARRVTAWIAAAGLGAVLLGAAAVTYPVRSERRYVALDRRPGPLPPLVPSVSWSSLPRALVDYARHHAVYHPYFDLSPSSPGSLYPGIFNVVDLLAAGRQPGALTHALLDRRFDAVALLPAPRLFEVYAAAYGRREDNYLWKLNRVISARYRATTTLPGLLVRRRGPERAAWMRGCFGPFRFAGGGWEIRHGGGFWCLGSRDALRLRDTPAAISEVVTSDPPRELAGELAVTIPVPGGSAEISAGPSEHPIWALRLVRRRAGFEVSVLSAGPNPLPVLLPGTSARLRFVRSPRSGTQVIFPHANLRLPPALGAILRLAATRGSDTTFVSRGLRVR